MDKKYKVIISLTLALIILIVLPLIIFLKGNSTVFKITIHPTGTLSNSYYFVLKQNRVLYCSVGDRQNNDIGTNEFLEVTVKHAKKKLTKQDYQQLINLVNQIGEYGNDYKVKEPLGYFFVSLYYDNEVYETSYFLVTNMRLINLINRIIDISPVDVDLNIFA